MVTELEKLLLESHKDVALFDYEGKKVPCIILDEKKFYDVMRTIAGKPFSVVTNLNILDDRCGHVFVKITLQFSLGDIEEKFLIYANEHVEFFEALAETGMLKLDPPNLQSGSSNIIMIQLPKPERAQNALEIIRKGLQK